jgi:hypothetical protein
MGFINAETLRTQRGAKFSDSNWNSRLGYGRFKLFSAFLCVLGASAFIRLIQLVRFEIPQHLGGTSPMPNRGR